MQTKIDLTKIQALKTDGLMRTEEFTPNYLELLDISEDNLDDLIEIALDKDLKFADAEDEKDIYLPCHALQALGQYGTTKPLNDILERLNFFEDDDYYENAVMHYLEKIGSADKIDILLEYFLDKTKNDSGRMIVLEAIENIFQKKGSLPKDMIENSLVQYLEEDDEWDELLNAFAIFFLIDISKDKHIELIRQVFERKPVDIFYDGDLEDIEIKLGLREKRETKPQRLYDDFFDIDEIDDMDNLSLLPLVNDKPKVGRNDPCPCGSGKKYKKCCLNK